MPQHDENADEVFSFRISTPSRSLYDKDHRKAYWNAFHYACEEARANKYVEDFAESIATQFAEGYIKGIEMGIKMGIRKNAIENARTIKKMGIDSAAIAKIMKLGTDTIESL